MTATSSVILQALGHTVRLMAPQFVKAYVKSNKNDARWRRPPMRPDAEAICDAVTRPSMGFAPVKNVEQQSVLACIGTGSHRALVSKLTARRNHAFAGAMSIASPVLDADYVARLLARPQAEGMVMQPSLEPS
jgi:transposase